MAPEEIYEQLRRETIKYYREYITVLEGAHFELINHPDNLRSIMLAYVNSAQANTAFRKFLAHYPY